MKKVYKRKSRNLSAATLAYFQEQVGQPLTEQQIDEMMFNLVSYVETLIKLDQQKIQAQKLTDSIRN